LRPAISACFFTQRNISLGKFDEDDEVQKEIMTWFNGQVADFYDLGIKKLFPRLINIWKMPATMLKNKVMYRQFIQSFAFVN
jgi:hypothetical protein